MKLQTFFGVLLLNLPGYVCLWAFVHGVGSWNGPEGAGEFWGWISIITYPLAFPCWILALILSGFLTVRHVGRVRKGSRETVYPLVSIWILSAPFILVLADVENIFR
jgi:hypothetical protein